MVVVILAVPSPKPQLYDNGKTPPVDEALKVVVTVPSGEAGATLLTVAPDRAAATITDRVGEADVTPLASVIVTAALNVPAPA